jgi:hypothetical protein
MGTAGTTGLRGAAVFIAQRNACGKKQQQEGCGKFYIHVFRK